jgi:hypothetical protein
MRWRSRVVVAATRVVVAATRVVVVATSRAWTGNPASVARHGRGLSEGECARATVRSSRVARQVGSHRLASRQRAAARSPSSANLPAATAPLAPTPLAPTPPAPTPARSRRRRPRRQRCTARADSARADSARRPRVSVGPLHRQRRPRADRRRLASGQRENGQAPVGGGLRVFGVDGVAGAVGEDADELVFGEALELEDAAGLVGAFEGE